MQIDDFDLRYIGCPPSPYFHTISTISLDTKFPFFVYLTLLKENSYKLEDSIFAGKATMAESKGKQVEMVVHIAKVFNIDDPIPDETRELIRLKSVNKANFWSMFL